MVGFANERQPFGCTALRALGGYRRFDACSRQGRLRRLLTFFAFGKRKVGLRRQTAPVAPTAFRSLRSLHDAPRGAALRSSIGAFGSY